MKGREAGEESAKKTPGKRGKYYEREERYKKSSIKFDHLISEKSEWKRELSRESPVIDRQ